MAAKKASKNSLVDKVVLLGSSLAYLTKDTTNQVYEILEEHNVISTKEGKDAVEKVKGELEKRKGHVQKQVLSQLSKVIDQLGIATKKDLENLKKSPKRSKSK